LFTDILGLRVFSGSVDQIPYLTEGKVLINTINPRVFTISRENKLLKTAFEKTEYLIEDGQYFAFAPLLLQGKMISKISGTKVFYHLMRRANENRGKVFLLGSTEKVLRLMKERAIKDYPNVKIESLSPPYRESFTKEENNEIIEQINNFVPDIVFVGMTAPKQEIWAYQNKEYVNAHIICAVGAVFDWYAGVLKQPEDIWVKLGLEWFIRTIRRPEILKRYPDYLYFFWLVFLNLIKIRKD